MSWKMRAPVPIEDPNDWRFLGCFGLGGMTVFLDRYPTCVRAYVYNLDLGLRTFETEIPIGAHDSLGFMWGLELCADLGGTGEVLYLREGMITYDEFVSAVTASVAIRTAQYSALGDGAEQVH